MAFEGVSIGISDALPRNRRFWRGRARVSGSPVLENWLVTAAFPAFRLLFELYYWVCRSLSALHFPLFLGACV